jgi:hypothetical protein
MNCRSCLTGEKRKVRCEFSIPGQEAWSLNGQDYKGCPFKLLTLETANYLKAYNYYRRGYLANPGGWLEQPAKMLDAFEVIDKEHEKIELEKEKKRDLFKR